MKTTKFSCMVSILLPRVYDARVRLEFAETSSEKNKSQFGNWGLITSKKVQNWFKDNGIIVMKWSAQSPDLNPIEHPWYHLKKKFNAYENPLTWALEESGEGVECNRWICQWLIESMPRHIVAVLKAKEKYAKYNILVYSTLHFNSGQQNCSNDCLVCIMWSHYQKWKLCQSVMWTT